MLLQQLWEICNMGVKNKNIEDFYPLSPMQQGILFHSLADPKSNVYFEQLSWTLQAKLNITAFHRAWEYVVERHAILRTCFIWEGLKEPVQIVHRQVSLPWQEYNWQHLSPEEQQQKLELFWESDRSSGFELTHPPLMRLTLVQLSENSYNFTWSNHHLLLDGWSTALVFKEVFACYKAFSNAQDLYLEPIRPYRDYIVWLQQQNLSEAETFWRQTLQGFTTPTQLLVNKQPARKLLTQADSYQEREVKLSVVTTAALRQFAMQHQLTLNTLVQGAWALLLSRYSGQEDVVFGAVTSGRSATLAKIESMVGLLINTLPIRVQVSPEEYLLPWLEKIKDQLIEVGQYEYCPLVKIQGWSEVPKSLSLFESIVVFENYPIDASLQQSDINLQIKDFQGFEKTNYPITLTVMPGEELLLKITSDDGDRFDTDTITRMLGHLQTLLEGMVTKTEQRLGELSLLTETERHQLLVGWNDTEVEYPQQQCIHDLFEAQVEKTPDAVAVVFEDQELTYCELNAKANQLAHHLQELGVKPEVLVGICVERSLDMAIGLLAILKAGGAYIPLDPSYPKERLVYMLEDSQPSVLLTQQYLVESLPTHKAKVVCIDGDWRVIANKNTENPPSNITCKHLAYIIYTSGSTGKPKGAMNTHRGICNRLLWMQDAYELTTADSVLQKTPFSFDVSVWEFFWPLLTGARLVVAQPEGHRDTNYLVNLILQQQITTLHFVPSMMQVFLEAEGLEKCQSLVRVIASGEALPAQLQQRFFNRLDAQLHNLYGPTEAAVDVTFWECKDCVTNQKIVPIGRPIANIKIYLLDKYLNPVAIGVTGEVYIGGVGIGRGYLNRPELTAENFIPNPFSDKEGDRLYKTGDLARYLPNGEIEYIGRIDNQVKIRGFRIELGEIEAVITQHPAVREAVVVVSEDSGDSKRIVAYVVPQKEQTLTISELRNFLESKLPNYMIPGAFVILEALPLTPNGKVDRKALPIPELTQISSSNIILPSTPIENLLADIWAEILGIEKIGINNNFFELGGHSLIATRVNSQIRQVFQVELPLRCLFEKPTIAELAKEIEKAIKVDSGNEATNIERIVRSPELPLSFAQQRLWFLDRLEPNNPFYNMPAAVRLEGQLNVEALQQSFNEIISRHEALRTNFQTREGQAIAVICETASLILPVFDLSELPLNQQEAEVKKQTYKEAQKPFDLKGDLLLRVKLLRLSQEEHIILLTMHHIVSDGWSIDILVRELATLYQAFCDGQPSPLPALPIQYVDFAAWQRQWLQGEVLKNQTSYWLKQLENAPKVLELPTDYPRPAIETFRGSTYSFKLSEKLSFALNKFSQQQGSTLFMTLLAAFQTLLWRYTGNEDIVVGSPIANRNRAEIEGLIGLFVNTLVLRTNLAGNLSFEELLKRVREVALGAYAHQDLPFELLVDQLQPERDLSHTPLFQVMFVLQNAPMSALELSGLTLSFLESDTNSAKFDLTLEMTETVDGLLGNLEYNTDLFEESSIQRMAGHLQTLLEGVVANPQQRLSELPLLTESERHQLLVEWNDTEVEYPQQLCIHQLFEAQVEKTPNAVAVVFEKEQLTYQQLNQRANHLAHYLRTLGVGSEVLVGIYIERSLEMLIGILGILKAGGAYVPLDPAYPQERLAFMLEDAKVSFVISQSSLVIDQALQSTSKRYLEVICLDTHWRAIAQGSTSNLPSNTTSKNLAYVIYTSGSTGQPKGVMVEHGSLVNVYWAWEKAYDLHTLATSHLQMASFSFDVFSGDLVRSLCSGGKLVLCPREILLSPSDLYQLMLEEKIDCAEFVPAVLRNLVQYLEDNQQRLDFMRLLICGSDSWYGGEYRKFSRLCSPQTRLINSFGVTESTIDSSYFESATQELSVEQLVPIGKPFIHTILYILDSKLGLLPIGVPGEIYISGTGLARGYFKQAVLTAQKFIPNPFSDKEGDRLYKTGDLARYLPNGEIEYIGRIDNQVKIRGFRIELGEIEAVITQHPAVREAVVVVSEDSGDSKRIVAYVVPQKEQTLIISELRNFLESKLPNYMIPGAFVILEALPLTPNGKVDRKALPIPELTQISSSNIILPSTPIENLLADIWAEILGIEKIGINNNFFELGGHSLIATRVNSQIRQVFQVELPLRCLFEKPTIAELAKEIEKAIKVDSGNEATNIERIVRSPELPLSFAQQRLWFLDRLEPNNPFYNMPAAVRLEGQLNVEALQQSFNEIISRHEALRTNFQTREGQAIAVICETASLILPVFDLSELPLNQQEAEVKKQTYKEAQKPFDLKGDLLLRVKLLRLSQEEHIILLTMHHIVSDGWSIDILVRELATLYQAFCDGQPSPLPALPIQYVDFAAWQRQWLQGEVLKNQTSYWLKQLENAPKVLELPTDYPRPAIETFRGSTYSFKLSEKLSFALNKFSQQQGSTLFMTLLAAFQTLLWRYTGNEDIVVGSPIANRNRAEIEGLIGLFVNTLVLRTNLAGNLSFEELLKRVREVALGAYAHQDLPFELLVDQLQPERDLSHTPLFQVMFVLQNAPMSALELSGLTLSFLESDTNSAKFDLTLEMTETVDGLLGNLEYNTDLFEESSIQRMAGHLQTLLEGVVANPQQRLSELPLLTESERHQLLVEWNGTEVEYPQQLCIHQLFEAQVEKTPNAVAVVFEKEQLTYQQLNQRANQLAHHLQQLGVKPEVLVGICVERTLSMIIGLLAILKAGGAYVPIDPAYPPERISLILQSAQVSVLLTQQHLIENFPKHRTKVVCLDTDWQTITQQSQTNPISDCTSDNLAYIIYTSGSTGQPKGVLVNHANVARLLAATDSWYNFNQQDVWTLFHSIAFDFSVWEIWGALLYGGKLIVVPYWLSRSPEDFYQLLLIQQVTILNQTPSAFRQLIQVEESLGNSSNLRLRAVIFGGEALQIESLRPWFERHGDKSPQLVNMYGITETTVHVTYRPLTMADLELASASVIGRPIPDLQVYLLDSYQQPVAIGIPGELHIGGLGLARGYLNQPELTALKFIPNPFSKKEGDRLYKTGDLVRFLSSGDIEYLGRIDNQVKIRGFRVELGEIEAAIIQHPSVSASVVMLRENKSGNQSLIAYTTLHPEKTLTIPELRRFLQNKLLDHMVPNAFMILEALPLTSNGKVDRQALPMPDVLRPELEVAYVIPQTEVEKTIASVWQKALNLEKVGIHDNFFEIGGHSLLLVTVHSQLQKILKSELSTLDLFRYPTINSLAEYLSSSPNSTELLQENNTQAEKISSGKAQQRKRLQKIKSVENN
ncbi:MAG: amino acid adenylation domain-containing protein [Nostochopsis sp.]